MPVPDFSAFSRASWNVKLERAKHHLDNLEGAIHAYVGRHPYAAGLMPHLKDQPYVQRYALRVFMDMELHISAVLGDFVQNLRASLDHVVAATVTTSTQFPIITRDIWAAPNAKNLRERERFKRCIAGMPDAAKAAVKRLQPGVTNSPATRALAVLQRLSNEDKHTNLLPFMIGLKRAVVVGHFMGRPFFERWHNACEKDAIVAQFTIAPDLLFAEAAVKMEIRGTPEIAVDVGPPDGQLEIRKVVRELMRRIPVEVIPYLDHFA